MIEKIVNGMKMLFSVSPEELSDALVGIMGIRTPRFLWPFRERAPMAAGRVVDRGHVTYLGRFFSPFVASLFAVRGDDSYVGYAEQLLRSYLGELGYRRELIEEVSGRVSLMYSVARSLNERDVKDVGGINAFRVVSRVDPYRTALEEASVYMCRGCMVNIQSVEWDPEAGLTVMFKWHEYSMTDRGPFGLFANRGIFEVHIGAGARVEFVVPWFVPDALMLAGRAARVAVMLMNLMPTMAELL